MRIVPRVVALSVVFLLAATLTASAQVRLAIRGGRVTLAATNATVRQILTEWARVGKTDIVNVERIPGGPLTLQFTDVPEPEALDLLLRSVTGYVAAERPVPLPGLSRYGRILVLPTAAAAPGPAVAIAAPAPPTPVSHQPKGPRQPFSGNEDDGPPDVPLFPTPPPQPAR